MDESIFKAYDIRGVYPDQINEEITEKIAQAFIIKTGAKKVVVGHDERPHSPALLGAIHRGLTKMGVNVIDIDLCTTPMFYYAVKELGGDAGVMVTASHNPAQYNGLKLTLQEAIPFGDQEIQDLKDIIKKGDLKEADRPGQIEHVNIFEKYKQMILSFANIKRRLNIVVDIANGMGGLTVPKILDDLPITPSYLFEEIDLSFPNHEANPLKVETLTALQAEVKAKKADIGIAFDGDADRVGFIDEKGEIVPMDLITAFLAEGYPEKKVCYDVRSSWKVKEVIEKNNGTPIPSKVGHYFIKKKMRAEDIDFCGEVSGHYYFKEIGSVDSAIFTAIKVLNLVSQSDKPFSEIMAGYKTYFKIVETNFQVKDKDKKIAELKEKYKDGTLTEIDGIRIEYDDWWYNVRSSNTEPLLRLNAEAKTQELLDKKVKEIEKIITE